MMPTFLRTSLIIGCVLLLSVSQLRPGNPDKPSNPSQTDGRFVRRYLKADIAPSLLHSDRIAATQLTLPKKLHIFEVDTGFTEMSIDSVEIWPGQPAYAISLYRSPRGSLVKLVAQKLDDRSKQPRSPEAMDDNEILDRGICNPGIPHDDPLRFADVIHKCPLNAAKASHISAIFVTDSCASDSVRIPVWVISLEGLPPQPIFGPPRLSDDRAFHHGPTNSVVVMDAVTGRPILSGSFK